MGRSSRTDDALGAMHSVLVARDAKPRGARRREGGRLPAVSRSAALFGSSPPPCAEGLAAPRAEFLHAAPGRSSLGAAPCGRGAPAAQCGGVRDRRRSPISGQSGLIRGGCAAWPAWPPRTPRARLRRRGVGGVADDTLIEPRGARRKN